MRRSGDRLRVTVQLIDARKDRHIWAELVRLRGLGCADLAGELAKEIAHALHATLSPEEKSGSSESRRATPTPTRSIFARGTTSSHPIHCCRITSWRATLRTGDRARSKLPSPTRAATTRAAIFHYHEPLETWKTKVLAGAEEALRLQPNLAEAHSALGYYYYWTERNYDRALVEFSRAQQLAPSEASTASVIAAIHRRQGHWPEARELYGKATTLDPQNANVVTNFLYTLTGMRDSPAAAATAERLRRLVPDGVVSNIQAAYAYFSWKRQHSGTESGPGRGAGGEDPDGFVTASRWDLAMIERDYNAAELKRYAAPRWTSFPIRGRRPLLKAYFEGCIALARGETAAAEAQFAAALPRFEAAVAESPLSAERHANLGLLYAFREERMRLRRPARRRVDAGRARCGRWSDHELLPRRHLCAHRRERPGDFRHHTAARHAGSDRQHFLQHHAVRFEAPLDRDPLRNDSRFQQLLGERH